MARYEVEYALFKKCVIEADSLEEAKDKAHTAEDEEIESMEIENTGYVVWEEPKKIYNTYISIQIAQRTAILIQVYLWMFPGCIYTYISI